MSAIYYGETVCSHIFTSGKNKGKRCENNAYYVKNSKYLCGVHTKGNRVKLPINPRKEELLREKVESERKCIEEVAEENRKRGKIGEVTVTKLRMMKKPDDIYGFLKVFPNFKHQNRKDGFGYMRLSPKALGPVDHKMPGLPIAQNIENYHQFAKIFPFEAQDEETIKKAKELRIKAYQSNVPHRHKYSAAILKQKNINIPLYSVYYDQEGEERRYTYIQCRYFYCHWYEKLAKRTEEYKQLVAKREQGYNLQIVGYDGYKPTEHLYTHYMDASRPFGHELVLYSLLVIEKPENYPWNRFYRENEDIYKGVI